VKHSVRKCRGAKRAEIYSDLNKFNEKHFYRFELIVKC